MIKMNMQDWMAGMIRQKAVAAIPIMTHPGIELGGRTVREAVSDGEVHAEAVIRLCERYPSAAACTIMDLNPSDLRLFSATRRCLPYRVAC